MTDNSNPPSVSAPQPKNRQRDASRHLVADSNFRRLWWVGWSNETMRWLEIVATSVFVFELTGSALAVALVNLVRMAPTIFVGVFAGELAERVSRKTLVMASLALSCGTSIVLGTLVLVGVVAVWHIAVGGLISGLVFTVEFPGRRNLIGEIAGSDRVGAAMALDSVSRNSTRVFGPALGGLLLQQVGLEGAYYLAALFYAISFVILGGLVYRPPRLPKGRWKVFSNIVEGMRYVRSRRTIVGVLVITVVMNVWGFVYATMVPVIGKEEYHVDAFSIGLLLSAEGLGAMIGALTIALYAQPRHFAKLYLYGPVLFLTGLIGFAISNSFLVSLAILFVGGIGMAGFNTMQGTIPFLAAPPEIRGRVMGVLSMAIGTGPIGILHVGLLAHWLGAPAAVMIIAVEGLVAIIATVILLPEVR